MDKIAVIYSEYSPTIDALLCKFGNYDVKIFQKNNTIDKLDDFKLTINLCPKEFETKHNSLAVHRSLLPAFDTNNPIADAFSAGVKVTGLTIYYTQTNKILAQYPVFIYNDSHYDELVEQLRCIEQMLLPLVVEKVINNEQFEVAKLLQNSGGCGGCSKCSH